jgi:hypothetical protein
MTGARTRDRRPRVLALARLSKVDRSERNSTLHQTREQSTSCPLSLFLTELGQAVRLLPRWLEASRQGRERGTKGPAFSRWLSSAIED